jgi:hypothetical protein
MVQALSSLVQTKLPVYLWGPPGVGKSSLVRQAAASNEMDVCDIRAVLLDPVDLRGLPRVDKSGVAQWCPPAFLPRKGQGILFLDELAQAPPLVQAACLQLTLDRRIGEYALPDGWAVVAASNRQEDRAGAHRLITPLLNRFVHLDLEVSNDDWQTWAIAANIAPEVRAFLRFCPGDLFSFDPSRNERAFPTPRSWEAVSKIISIACVPQLTHSLVAGCIGEGIAAKFCAFVRLFHELPDVDNVLATAATVALPTKLDIQYALCGAIVERCRTGNQKVIDDALTICRRLNSDEMSLLLARDILTVAKTAVLMSPQKVAILQRHRAALNSSD